MDKHPPKWIGVNLFHPRKVPVYGMSSYMDAAALDPGWWALLQNVRADKGTIRVRNGNAKLTSTAINSGSGTFGGAGVINYRGFWTGNPLLLAAVEDTGAVEVHSSTDAATWAEASDGSGPYGNTRMSALASGDGRLYFSPGLDRITNDPIAIVQNGVDSPRIFSTTAAIDNFATHYAITPPAGKMRVVSRTQLESFFNVFSGSGTPSTPTGTSLAFTETATPVGDVYLTLTATNPVQNDQALYVFGDNRNFTNARQLVIIVNGAPADQAIWDYLKIEMGNSTPTYQTVYDSSTAGLNQYVVDSLDGSNNYIYGFSLDHLQGATGMSTWNRIRLTWAGTSITAATFTVKIYVVGESGKVPGNSLHCYTYSNSTSKAESVPQFVTEVLPRKISEMGGTRSVNLDIGTSSKIFYEYYINFLHTTEVERDLGTDKLNLYRKDQEDSEYYYVKTVTLATYSGSWSFSNHGSTSALGACFTQDTTLAKNYQLRAPDPEHAPLMAGKAMLLANGRLFVAAGSTPSKLYVSEHRYHTRFRDQPRLLDDGTIDPRSATMYPFDGEIIQALASSSVGYGGTSFVYVFTDKAIYQISPNVHQIQKMASLGTLSPRTVSEYRSDIFFLDSDGRVMMIRNGTIIDISDRLVEDITRAIPTAGNTTSRHSKASGLCFDGLYHLGYTPSGGSTNTRKLVFDIEQKRWYDDLAAAGSYEELMLWNSAGLNIPITVGSNLHVYQVEKPAQTTDDGTIPTMKLTTGEFQYEEWKEFAIGRVGVVCDDASSGSIAVSRAFSPGTGSPSTSTISVDVSTDEAWRYDQTISGTDRRGYRAQITLTSSTLPGGTNIRQIMAQIQPRGAGTTVPTS